METSRMTSAAYGTSLERPVISLQNVTKSFGEFRLGPLDVEVEPGYVVAVVGPNGSGKSTLFRMLMDLVHPDGGGVRIFGDRYPEDAVSVKRRIGYVPEQSVGHDELDAREFGSFVAHWYPSWNDRLYTDLLRRFEIDPGQRFDRLSKGMRRRLAFAAAVAAEPELLLLDEPTDGVDPFARRLMLEEISTYLQNEDRSVLFATHSIEEVRRIADYILFLHKGTFLGLYEKDALLEEWKELWVDEKPDSGGVPGVVAVEDGTPVRLVTRSVGETGAALENRGVAVRRVAALDLEEILEHLIAEAENREPAADREKGA